MVTEVMVMPGAGLKKNLKVPLLQLYQVLDKPAGFGEAA